MKRRMITVMLTMITVTLNGCNYNRHATPQENAIESATNTTLESSRNNIEIYHTNTTQDYNEFYNRLENRKGNLIIEVVKGTVIDNTGCGQLDNDNGFIQYAENFAVGDRVQSIFIFNPENNSPDDIIFRADFIIE